MHLKSCPQLGRSELQTSQCSLFVRTCSSNHGNISRLPLGVISTNTLRLKAPPPVRLKAPPPVHLKAPPPVRLKAPPPICLKAPPPVHLQAPPLVCESNALRLYQTAVEDADAPPDVWTVIKPGHVREKIAIFASDGAGSETGSGCRDRTPSVCSDHAAMSGLSRAGKAKGSREENCSAKRRRRSGNNQNLQQDPRTRVQDTQQPSPRQSGGGQWEGEPVKATAAEEQKVSVVEMVSFLEQRASEQQLVLQRSSTTITLSRAPPPEARGEEPESIRVSDMVAKLESECLKRRTEGDLSRSNSLRRTVGRVLLAPGDQSPAPGDQSPAPCRPSSPSSMTSLSSLPVAQTVGGEPTGCSEPALTTPPSAEAPGAEPQLRGAEPQPGLLFLSRPPASQPRPPPARCDSGSQWERRRSADGAQEEAVAGVTPSQDFLLMRRRLQQLLEPRPLLAALPHHLLLQVLLLLPTQSLAALQCSCRYFSFIIRHYGVRPADSLWVSDPRYRDDPCKQCKRRYGGGDVSLCRWHHKPFCQALPRGPGYWMCCHAARRDAPGCNVGLHDNRWVPAFHSINAPIYRRGRHDDRA